MNLIAISAQNLDVIVRDNVHGGSVHDSLVQDLLQCDHDRFFTYKKHDGGLQTQTGVRVRFCEEREVRNFPIYDRLLGWTYVDTNMQLHYQPSGFLPIVQAWRSGITPYVPVEDLLLHKITSAPLRALRRDRFNDAKDALYLVKSVPGIQPPKIRLSPQQRVDIDECIQEFVPYSTEPEQFWRDILQI
ncbi:hypothetical protein BJY00DRAFT_287381 [Aspergillus carlsbadensis]|nr:hypothetical protein BJY00DRAFT_287381 [Aspergillus carlsbadensis]